MAGGLCNSLIGIEAATMALYDDLVLRAGCVRVFAAVTEFSVQTQLVVFPDRIVCPSSLYKTARYPVRQPGDREDECGRADRKKGKVIKKSTTMSRPEPPVIDGQEWTARSADEAVTIPVGTHVVIKGSPGREAHCGDDSRNRE